jgi:hypothetical protein
LYCVYFLMLWVALLKKFWHNKESDKVMSMKIAMQLWIQSYQGKTTLIERSLCTKYEIINKHFFLQFTFEEKFQLERVE